MVNKMTHLDLNSSEYDRSPRSIPGVPYQSLARELNVVLDPRNKTKERPDNLKESVTLVKYANTVGAQDVHLGDLHKSTYTRPPML